MATSNRGRVPKSFYFSRLYSDPFHQDADRISQIDFRTFDPFVPESRQTVANCKKHRRQRHELSDKCKHVLAIVDAQERLLSTKPETAQLAGYSAQGAVMKRPEISIEFGDGIPESAKEYVKFWIKSSGMVTEPFSRQYDVHNIKDEHNHPEKPSIVIMVPFVEVQATDENKTKVINQQFFDNPKIFASKNKIGNLRIYSVNKRTGDEDAVGYADQLPIKIIGRDIIGKNLQKAIRNGREGKEPQEKVKVTLPPNFYIEGLEGKPLTQEQERYLKDLGTWYKGIETRETEAAILRDKAAKEGELDPREAKRLDVLEHELARRRDTYHNLERKITNSLNEAEKEEFEALKESNIQYRQNKLRINEEMKHKRIESEKKKKIFSDLLSPSKNIAPNRVPNGGVMNPIGNALRVVESPFHIAANVAGALSSYVDIKREREERKLKNDLEDAKRGKFEPREFKINRKDQPEQTGSLQEPSIESSEPTEDVTVEEEPEKDLTNKPVVQETADAEEAGKTQAPDTNIVPKVENQSEQKTNINKDSWQYLYTSDFNVIAKIKRRGL